MLVCEGACTIVWLLHAELNLKKRKREDAGSETQGKPAEEMSLDEGEIPGESPSGVAGTSQMHW